MRPERESSSSRDLLLAAGQTYFADHGYSQTRLSDLTGSVGLTTGAFYRYFPSKTALYSTLFSQYAAELEAALASARSLEAFLERWIDVARSHAGVIRVLAEMTRAPGAETETFRALRSASADLLVGHLPSRYSRRDARTLALILVDTMGWYLYTEAVGWTETLSATRVAAAVSDLVDNGLFT